MFKANINALEKAGIRDDVIVMVGGAPVTQEYADAVGADGYAADASTAVRLAKDLIEQRRAARFRLAGVETVIQSPSQDRRHRARAAVLRDRRADQPDRAQGLPGQLQAGDLSQLEIDVAEQVAGGADMLDVNVGDPLADEVGLMREAIPLVQGLTDLPLCIDSSVIEALEAGLARLRGQGARQLRHRRGRAAGGDPADRRAGTAPP